MQGSGEKSIGGFRFLGLQYTALMATVTGLSVLIPYVGATVVATLVAAVAYVGVFTLFGVAGLSAAAFVLLQRPALAAAAEHASP